MDNVSFVVKLLGLSAPQSLKHFRNRNDAQSFGKVQVDDNEAEGALIYEASSSEVYAATEAVRHGQATLIQKIFPSISGREADSIMERKFEEAMAQGPEAMLKFLGL